MVCDCTCKIRHAYRVVYFYIHNPMVLFIRDIKKDSTTKRICYSHDWIVDLERRCDSVHPSVVRLFAGAGRKIVDVSANQNAYPSVNQGIRYYYSCNTTGGQISASRSARILSHINVASALSRHIGSVDPNLMGCVKGCVYRSWKEISCLE